MIQPQPQVKVWGDPQERLAQMNEERDRQNKVGIKMCHLNPVVVQQTAEETLGWDPKLALHEGGEHDSHCLVLRREIPIRRFPKQHLPGSEN